VPSKSTSENREKRAKAARERRAKETEADKRADRDRKQIARDAVRPVPVTNEEILKDASRFGPAVPDWKSTGLKKVRTGYRTKSKDGIRTDDLATVVGIQPFTRHGRALTIDVLGRGFNYNPAHFHANPGWWLGGSDLRRLWNGDEDDGRVGPNGG
jgi:hypothetical protein